MAKAKWCYADAEGDEVRVVKGYLIDNNQGEETIVNIRFSDNLDPRITVHRHKHDFSEGSEVVFAPLGTKQLP